MRAFIGMARTSLVILALTAGSAGVSAQEDGVLDMVKECDVLAAHPSDMERVAEGVADERIVPRLAIRACEQAIADDPKDARFVFQLGRAKLAGGQKRESAILFEKAANAGHAAAWAYLGDAHQFGHAAPYDLEKAVAAYRKAAEAGFERGKALAELMDFEPSMYALKVIVELYNDNIDEVSGQAKLDDRKFRTRGYVFSMSQKFLAECDRPFSPKAVPALFKFKYGDGWTSEKDMDSNVTAETAAGEFDGQTFLKRHGCDGPVAKQLFAGIEKLVLGQ